MFLSTLSCFVCHYNMLNTLVTEKSPVVLLMVLIINKLVAMPSAVASTYIALNNCLYSWSPLFSLTSISSLSINSVSTYKKNKTDISIYSLVLNKVCFDILFVGECLNGKCFNTLSMRMIETFLTTKIISDRI